jgi:hypothetical protein
MLKDLFSASDERPVKFKVRSVIRTTGTVTPDMDYPATLAVVAHAPSKRAANVKRKQVCDTLPGVVTAGKCD